MTGRRTGLLLTVAALAVALLVWRKAPTESTAEVYVLPPGYTGPVLIIFGQRDGAPEEHLRDKRLYRIPPDGVLRTRFGDRQHDWYSGDFRYGSPAGPSIAMGWSGMPVPPGNPVLAWSMGRWGGDETPYNESYVVGHRRERPAMEARLDSLRERLLAPERRASPFHDVGDEGFERSRDPGKAILPVGKENEAP